MKYLKFVLLITLLISLVACGEKEENKVSENLLSGNSLLINTINNIDSTGSGEEITISMGEWNENTYTNEFLDLTFHLPEGWVYATNAELAKMMGLIINEDFKNENNLREIQRLNSISYMNVMDPEGGSSVSIISEKNLDNITLEEYLNNLKAELEATETPQFQVGSTITETLLDREFITMPVVVPDYKMRQYYYMYEKDGQFVGIIVTTSLSIENVLSIMSYFE